MKKLSILVFTVLLNVTFFSCNPESLVDDAIPHSCCGEEGNIPPPPPPPSTGNGG